MASSDAAATLPLLELRGGPREVGRAHGEGARRAVVHNLEVYARRFAEEGGLSPATVRARGAAYLRLVEARAPDYAETLRGLAEGSGRDLRELAALNARYELLNSELTRQVLEERSPAADGCTAFAALPEATPDGHLRLGQNWDWFPEVQGLLLRVQRPDGFRLLCFTEAGIAGGKIGLNAAGVGLVINGLASDRDSWGPLGLPFHVRTWRALNASTLEGALAAVLDGEPACAANFLLGAVGRGRGTCRVIDVETAPGASCRLVPRDGVLWHANHFQDPEALGVVETLEAETTSYHRGRRVQALLERHRGRLDGPTLAGILRDHEGYPGSICAHADATAPPGERYVTVFSALMDLHAGELLAAPGNPCVAPYERHTLG